MKKLSKLSKAFKALSDTNRLRILKMLEKRPMCVCEITEILQLATSTVSKHLSLLREAGFILDEKDGKWVNYYLNPVQDNEFVRHLLPLIRTWLPDDTVIITDRKKVDTVHRNHICKV